MAIALSRTEHRDALYDRFKDRIKLNPTLNRQLVSYQADKETPFYRWFKYREGFTSGLVHYLLENIHPQPGELLDPFVGSGSALFAATSLGWRATGIEVLPVGVHAIQARVAAERVDTRLFARAADALLRIDFASFYSEEYAFNHIPITRGAFPLQTEKELVGYIAYCNRQISDKYILQLALYASFCILEDISFTRKDGQYLRWDYRSGRSQGVTPFDKGRILSFSEALRRKLDQMVNDLLTGQHEVSGIQLSFDLFERRVKYSALTPIAIQSSSLELLPSMRSKSFDAVLTSPPYCNRYDYTRTYALELVYLGCSHEDVTRLRQTMLSCTVENRTKREQIRAIYDRLGRSLDFARVEEVFEAQNALHEVLSILEDYRAKNELNNANIVNMVRNYFYEMCFVIFEMHRVLAPGGHIIMVNDNVRYAGEEVPVDLILSNIAESFGLITDRIWTLARGKGNSSQQMGVHGRSELRKCVYVWERPTH